MVMVKIGLRSLNWPADEEKIILIQHIRENFGGHHLAEINLAFDMAIAGSLDAEANCYENFSCLYFSGIMNAYRKWSREEYRNVKPTQAPVRQIECCPDPKREFTEMVAMMKQDCKDGKFREDLVMDFFYDTAVKHELIDGKELTREEKKQAFIDFIKLDQ